MKWEKKAKLHSNDQNQNCGMKAKYFLCLLPLEMYTPSGQSRDEDKTLGSTPGTSKISILN